jgi:hypothetical protein
MPPKIPFFTCLKVGKVRNNSPSSTIPATVTTGATLPGPETSETDMTEQKVINIPFLSKNIFYKLEANSRSEFSKAKTKSYCK